MYAVARDASGCRTFRDVLSSQLHTWLRRRVRTNGRPGNEPLASDDAPLVDALHIRAPDGLPTTTTNAAGSLGLNATTPSASTSTTADQSPSTTNSGIIPAAVAVVIFVVCVFAILRILRAIRLNRLVAASTAEPQTPCMWEVRPDHATGPFFEGKWSEIMPLAAQRFTQCDAGSRFPPSRGMSVSTGISDSQTSHRGSGESSSHLLPLSIRKNLNALGALEQDYALPRHVAVLIAMPTANKHTSTYGEQPTAVGPICIGVVAV